MSIGSTGRAPRVPADRLALVLRVARLYHEQGVRQPEIAERLHLSQSRVSRLLKEAAESGIVRTVVVPPPGAHPVLEDELRERFHLDEVVVADNDAGDDSLLLGSIGGAAAGYLESTLRPTDRVGISSWSATLLATVDAMSPRSTRLAEEIVQVIGGVGNPTAQVQATRLTDDLARISGATPKFFPAPGIVGSVATRDALLSDPYLVGLVAEWRSLDVLLLGIGSVQPSPLLRDSGNAVGETELAELRGVGAVGDVCLRFFDAAGRMVDAELHDRVLGISSDDLRAVPRKIGVAGGERKIEAIRAAALGGWIDVLVTDSRTAAALLA